jgi:lipopolysaccharide transport system ATP-binding protein
LDSGQVRADGESSQVVSQYLQSGVAKQGEKIWDNVETAPGNDIVRFRRISVRPRERISSDLITMQTAIVVEVEFWNFLPNAILNINLDFITEDQVIAFSTGSDVAPEWFTGPFPVGLFRSVCHVPGNFLNSGVHRISLNVIKDVSTSISYHRDMVAFEVIDLKARQEGYYGKEPGVICPTLKWSTQCLDHTP